MMSVRELAAEAGITAKTLTDIEHGRRNPTYESMRGVCKVLGVDATQIAEFVATIAVRSKRHTPGT